MGDNDEKPEKRSLNVIASRPIFQGREEEDGTVNSRSRAHANVYAKAVIGAVFNVIKNYPDPQDSEGLKIATDIRNRWQDHCGGMSLNKMNPDQKRALLQIIADIGFDLFIAETHGPIDDRFYALFLNGMRTALHTEGVGDKDYFVFVQLMNQKRQVLGASYIR